MRVVDKGLDIRVTKAWDGREDEIVQDRERRRPCLRPQDTESFIPETPIAIAAEHPLKDRRSAATTREAAERATAVRESFAGSTIRRTTCTTSNIFSHSNMLSSLPLRNRERYLIEV